MVRIGDVRRAHGRDWVVLRRERGRQGEERTMIIVGHAEDSLPRETRPRSVVESWDLVRRAAGR